MLNSYEVAELLRQRAFHLISSPDRTKAHGYKHASMRHPVYVKIDGASGALAPVSEWALIIHPEEARRLMAGGDLPDDIRLATKERLSSAFAEFPRGETGSYIGWQVDVRDASALDALLRRLGGNLEPDFVADEVLIKAAEAEIDADEKCRGESITTRKALVDARVGQGGYRENLKGLWDKRCAVTGCAVLPALVASHAKAWKDSSNRERLDPHNGLLLAASIDRLFDRGLISFADDGQMLRKPDLTDSDLASLGLSPDAQLRTVHPQNMPYLAAHRQRFDFK